MPFTFGSLSGAPAVLAAGALFDVAVQLAGWGGSVAFRTDKIYDFTASCTYVALALLSFFLGSAPASSSSPRQVTATVLLALWAARLGAFLLFRVLRLGGDSRFEEALKKPALFLIYWLMQVRTSFFFFFVLWAFVLWVKLNEITNLKQLGYLTFHSQKRAGPVDLRDGFGHALAQRHGGRRRQRPARDRRHRAAAFFRRLRRRVRRRRAEAAVPPRPFQQGQVHRPGALVAGALPKLLWRDRPSKRSLAALRSQLWEIGCGLADCAGPRFCGLFAAVRVGRAAAGGAGQGQVGGRGEFWVPGVQEEDEAAGPAAQGVWGSGVKIMKDFFFQRVFTKCLLQSLFGFLVSFSPSLSLVLPLSPVLKKRNEM